MAKLLVIAFRKHDVLWSMNIGTLCNGPETLTEWKSESVTCESLEFLRKEKTNRAIDLAVCHKIYQWLIGYVDQIQVLCIQIWLKYRQDLPWLSLGKNKAEWPGSHLDIWVRSPTHVSILGSFPISTGMEVNIGQPLHRPRYWTVDSLQPTDLLVGKVGNPPTSTDKMQNSAILSSRGKLPYICPVVGRRHH